MDQLESDFVLASSQVNCKNCGASLEIDPTHRFLRCGYCETQSLAVGDKRSLDGIVVSTESTESFCPCCMDERQLHQGLLDRTRVAFCSDCFGFLVDSESLSVVLKTRRREYPGAEDVPVLMNQEELSRRRNCPQCEKTMETHPYYGPGNTIIDSCQHCDVIWLDNGDLAQLVRAPGLR